MAAPLHPGQVVMVTGGSGFLGQHIVKLLQEKADHVAEIRVFDIKPFVNKLGYEAIKPLKGTVGDLCNAAEVVSAMEGVDAVIHAAALITFDKQLDIEAMEEVNVKGTQNVIKACLEQNVKRLIYTSTVDVGIGYDDVINGDETAEIPRPFLLPGYPDTKYRGEQQVVSAHGTKLQSGDGCMLRTLVLRPNVIYGELDPYYVTNCLKSAQHMGGTLAKVGDGSVLYQQAYVGNVAWGHLVALQELERQENVGGQTYYLTDDTPLMSTTHFMEPFLNDQGFKLASKHTSYRLVYVILWTLEIFAKVIKPFYKLELPVQLCTIIYLNRNLYFSRQKAEKLLNYTPLYTYEQSMMRSRHYYAKLKLGGECDKELGKPEDQQDLLKSEG